jgi:hypothetical protein
VSLKEVGRLTFTNLRVTEVTLPALDGSSKEPASLTVTAQADSVAREKPSATPGTAKAKVGRLLESNFKLTMPGLDGTRVAKVSAITVKVSAGRVEVSNFTVALSEAAAEAWLQWHDLFIVQGKSTDQNEKTADIELLDATLKNTLMRIHLDGVGILRASSAQEGGANAIRRLVAELYAEGIRLEVK